jgi:hypothetical protein
MKGGYLMHARTWSPRHLFWIVLLATVATLVSRPALTPARSAASSARSPAVRECATSGLVIWMGPGNGTAGSIFYPLEFTNLSRRTCTLRGYPGVSAVDLASHRLGGDAGRNGYQPLATVTLARGAAATAVMRITDTGALPPSGCREASAAGVRVYPPGQRAAKIVPLPFQACSRGPSNITVSPIGPFKVE